MMEIENSGVNPAAQKEKIRFVVYCTVYCG